MFKGTSAPGCSRHAFGVRPTAGLFLGKESLEYTISFELVRSKARNLVTTIVWDSWFRRALCPRFSHVALYLSSLVRLPVMPTPQPRHVNLHLLLLCAQPRFITCRCHRMA